MIKYTEQHLLDIAKTVAKGAPCTRRQVGAILVVDGEVTAIGINAPEDAELSCLKGDCPRGKHYRTLAPGSGPSDDLITPDTDLPSHFFGKMCNCGELWPCPKAAVPAVSDYDHSETRCIAVHAEVAATRKFYSDHPEEYIPGRGRIPSQEAVLICTDVPCNPCAAYLKDAGVSKVVTPSGTINFLENQR